MENNIGQDILDMCEEFRAENKLLDISCRTLEMLMKNHSLMLKQMQSESGEERIENAFINAYDECRNNYLMASWKKRYKSS